MARIFAHARPIALGIAASLAVVSAAPATARSAAAPVAEAKDSGKICITGAAGSQRGDVTGSILKRKVCRSKAQWAADGIAFDDKGAPVAARKN